VARLDGKVAIVTGAKLQDGQVGIGGAIARAFAREGAKVVLANRTVETAEALAAELDASAGSHVALAVRTDLRVEAQVGAMVERTVETFGGVDVLVNNAAVTGSRAADGPALEVETESWDAIYALNVRAPFLTIKSVLPHMLERGEGAIVNVSSTASLSGDVIRTAYGSSKAALNMLTVYIATQYGRQGVRCNAIVPGLTVTGNVMRNIPAATWRILERQVLRPHPNDADDLANAALFLASREGAGVNGEVIRVDGGFLAHSPYAMDLRDLMTGNA
jgi:NAD(P)-dependent dehydrogenase (short-subunit alcohol dehydrogenase family)